MYLLFNLAKAKNYYHVVGMIIAISIVHGGPGPKCFSSELYKAIVYGFRSVKPRIEMLDYELKELFEKVSKIRQQIYRYRFILDMSVTFHALHVCNV